MKIKERIISVPADPDFNGNFKVRAPPKTFKVRAKRKPVSQPWFTRTHSKPIIGIADLFPDQEYAFFKFFDKGGFKVVTASGAAIQRSWTSCTKRDKITRFIASFHPRITNRCKIYQEPTSRWHEVVLHPRRDLYFTVQPVSKRHYARK